MSEKQKCELCSKKRSLKPYQDTNVCTSCSIVLSYAKNNPLALLSALERFDKLPAAQIPDQVPQISSPPTKSWPQDLVARIQRLEKLGVRIREMDDLHKKFFEFCGQFRNGDVVANGPV